MGITSDARTVWRLLNGVFTVYKPAGVSVYDVRKTIIAHLCRDLNELEVRPQSQHVRIVGETNREMRVVVGPSFADHPLVIGPRYQCKDVRLSWANYLSKDTSGVLVLGINGGVSMAHRIRESRPTRFYRVKGILGQATDNFFTSGKIVEKAKYEYIRRVTIDKLCASMQASHQRKMFELCGVDIQSQAAYELAIRGPIRPANNKLPMIYAIKCVDLASPEFILEIVCINEYEMYLKGLIHEIGMQCHSVATCAQVQCFQFGLFNTELALLQKHWTLQCILDNMKRCGDIIRDNEYLLHQDSPILIEQNHVETITSRSSSSM